MFSPVKCPSACAKVLPGATLYLDCHIPCLFVAMPQDGEIEVVLVYTCISCKAQEPKENCTPAGKDENGHINSYRCKKCNSSRVRVKDALKRHPSIEEHASEFTNPAALAAKAKELYGEELVLFLKQEYQSTYEASAAVEMVGTGVFMDKEDLETKYKDKPTRLAAILRNTTTYYCTKSETLLYEDLEYKSVRTDRVEAKRSTSAEVSSERKKLKKARTPKAGVEAEGYDKGKGKGKRKGAPEEPKQLTQKHSEQLTKAKDDIAKELEKMTNGTKCLSEKENQNWAKFAPSYINDGIQETQALGPAVVAKIEHILAEGAALDLKGVQEEIKACKAKTKESLRKALVQIEEAKALV